MSENSSKIGKYQFVAEPFHVDFTGRLTMGVLGNHLLNCAGFHASDRGFGIATLNEDNYTWVLSRLAIELDEMPYQYEDFTIWTWVENVYRLFTDRNFALLDKDGKKIGYARSVWAMINLNTRKPADLLALHGGSIVDYVCDEPCPIEKPSRINVMCHAIRLLPVLTIRWIIRQEWIFPVIRISLFLPLIWQSVPTIILWEDMRMIPVPVCFTWQTIISRRVRSNGPGVMAISDRPGIVT